MGTEAGIEGSEKGVFQESLAQMSGSCLSSSTEQIPDPVVYKLVRVEVDGRLVPATDDEVMEVEELLMDNKNEMHVLEDTGQDAECTSNGESSSRMFLLKDPEGISQSDDGRGQPDKLNPQLKENDPSLVPSLSDGQNKGCSVGEYSNLSDKPVEGDSSTSATVTASKPDFSKIKGEICLDNLSIRELQETFRATFGRETNVKDKLWLKRRIAMGLTNSCDVSTTSFIIKDNKLVKKENEETRNNMGVTSLEDAATTTDLRKKSPPIHTGQLRDKQLVSDKKLDSKNEICESEDSHAEQRAAKRARKPTRRYIEEISEVDSREANARFTAPNDHSTVGYVRGKSNFRSVGSISSDSRPMITRLDSLGIQVPHAYRIRRSRPRTNYTALLTVNPSSVEKAAGLIKAPSHDFQSSNVSRVNTFRAISAPRLVQDQAVSRSAEDKQLVVVQTVGLGLQQELKHSSLGNPVDRVAAVSKASGYVRRKHQRAWTLSEVIKLVDGVSRYGAGRWSEIKKVAFASSSYRTSVDLKDKWRNLLKASLALGLPNNKEISSRKSGGATPLPAPILLKVRELAEVHAQIPPNCSSSKSNKSIGANVRERRPVLL